MGSHRRWFLFTSESVVLVIVFCHCLQALAESYAENSELSLICGWTEVQICHGQ